MTGADVERVLAGLPGGKSNDNGNGNGGPSEPPGDYGGAAPASLLALDAHLPDEFWEARAVLGHIRAAAQSCLVAPDAVFGSVLARVAAITPHTVELPAIVGTPIGLTFYVAVPGPPESGKSAAVGVAAELVPAPPERVIDGLPIGSGEGMVERLFEWVEEEDAKGKLVKVKRQTHNAAIFLIDEGSALGELGGRSGSTLLPTLRSAYTNGTLGNTNASADRRRILDGRSYVYGVTMGIQPEMAGPLLADAAAGTPQRFIWVSATDPGAPDEAPEWPGELDWHAPDTLDLDRIAINSGGWRRHRLDVAGVIRAEVQAERRATMRGEVERAPLDAHRTLARLKVAALLAILDNRHGLEAEDWDLAGIVLSTSRRVRAGVEAALVGVARRKETAATERHTRRELHVEDSKEQRALTSAARSAARVVARHVACQEHEGEGCVQRCMARAIAGKHRALVGVDEVVTEAERCGWIRADGGRWLPGESRPK